MVESGVCRCLGANATGVRAENKQRRVCGLVGWWDGRAKATGEERERNGEYEKETRRREEDQQPLENLQQQKEVEKKIPRVPSIASLAHGGKFAWRQSSPAQSCRPQSCRPPKPGCWVSKPRRRVGRYQPATPRVLLGLYARNAMRLSLGGKNPAAEQSYYLLPACLPACRACLPRSSSLSTCLGTL